MSFFVYSSQYIVLTWYIIQTTLDSINTITKCRRIQAVIVALDLEAAQK